MTVTDELARLRAIAEEAAPDEWRRVVVHIAPFSPTRVLRLIAAAEALRELVETDEDDLTDAAVDRAKAALAALEEV